MGAELRLNDDRLRLLGAGLGLLLALATGAALLFATPLRQGGFLTAMAIGLLLGSSYAAVGMRLALMAGQRRRAHE